MLERELDNVRSDFIREPGLYKPGMGRRIVKRA